MTLSSRDKVFSAAELISFECPPTVSMVLAAVRVSPADAEQYLKEWAEEKQKTRGQSASARASGNAETSPEANHSPKLSGAEALKNKHESENVHRPVPFDAELRDFLASNPYPPMITPEMIGPARQGLLAIARPIREIVGSRPVTWEDLDIPGADGTTMRSTVFRPQEVTGPTPVIVHTHGGGMIFGDRFVSNEVYLEWVVDLGITVITFDYRLAPEHPYPAAVEDCYSGLVWAAKNADALGIDPERLAVGGGSAGGGLAAAVALLARDRGGPKLAAQILICPMLDDRNETFSNHQLAGVGAWDRTSNDTGWDALLGNERGGPNVSPYAAPARAKDLSNLPPAIIDVGSAEIFRDEDVDYASRIWQAGGIAELHVWPGGFHGFDGAVLDAKISRISRKTRNEWIRRTLID
jgi:acetyl esterase/lipase